MGRLPKEIRTDGRPKAPLRAWIWAGLGIVLLGAYGCYGLYKFKPTIFLNKPSPVVQESQEPLGQMEEPTTQDLQALPIAQETAEEAIFAADLQHDPLVQIFDAQEESAAKTDAKPKAPLVVKRSLGLV